MESKNDPSRYEQNKVNMEEELGEMGSLEDGVEEKSKDDHSQCEENKEKNAEFGVNDQVHVDLKNKSGRVQRQGNWKGVDPVLFLRDEALIMSIISFYGIKETFPLRGHLVTRSEDTSRLKRIYYVSESVSNVMKMNFRSGEQIKITSIGLKLFVRNMCISYTLFQIPTGIILILS